MAYFFKIAFLLMFSTSSDIFLLTLFVVGVAQRRRMSFICSKIIPMLNKIGLLLAWTIHQISIQWQQIDGSTTNFNSNKVFCLCVLYDTLGEHEMWRFFREKFGQRCVLLVRSSQHMTFCVLVILQVWVQLIDLLLGIHGMKIM